MSVDVAKLNNLTPAAQGIQNPQGRGLDKTGGGVGDGKLDNKFGELLRDRMNPNVGGGPASGASLTGTAASAQMNPNGIKFSNHAIERLQTRGIRLTPEHMERLNSAVQKAESKGAKETLVLMDNAALIVSIKNKTVVTAMDKSMMKDNVFTNIDSTVVI